METKIECFRFTRCFIFSCLLRKINTRLRRDNIKKGRPQQCARRNTGNSVLLYHQHCAKNTFYMESSLTIFFLIHDNLSIIITCLPTFLSSPLLTLLAFSGAFSGARARLRALVQCAHAPVCGTAPNLPF